MPDFNQSFIDTLITSQSKYYKYSQAYYNFNDSSIYYNEFDSIISHKFFFRQLYYSSYFPLKSRRENKYKLFFINYWPNENIQSWVRGEGYRNFRKFSLIGKTLLINPLIDLNGRVIDSTFIKNKLVFVKCWFIKCLPCIAEMPELNKIVDLAKNRKDVLFISFAYDKKDMLIKFMKNHTFNYAVLPTYKIPEIDSLKISSFPTHLFVKNNIIEKVISKEDIPKIISMYKP